MTPASSSPLFITLNTECYDSARKVLEKRIMEKLARSFNDMQAAAFN